MDMKDRLQNAGKAFVESVTPGTEEDILDTLKQEHDEVEALLDKLVKSDSAAERKSLLAKVKAALVPHTRAEQSTVYDRVAALPGDEAKRDAEEGYIEHGLASQTLKELEKVDDAASPAFSAHAKVLKELVEHHVKEEERNIWALVRNNFTPEQRAAMNRDFLAAKETVPV
jgi:hypothetical protein